MHTVKKSRFYVRYIVNGETHRHQRDQLTADQARKLVDQMRAAGFRAWAVDHNPYNPADYF